MIDHALPKAVTVATAVGAAALAVSGVTDEHINFVRLLVAGFIAVVGGTIATMTWIDTRMDRKVKDSEGRVLAQIHHLKELLIEKGVIHHIEEE